MSPEAQRIAIAEACGWEDVHRMTKGPMCLIGTPRFSGVLGEDDEEVPNYLTDLNAMHEAEKVLTGKDAVVMAYNLAAFKQFGPDAPLEGAQSCMWHATATQRAEAFLRTIGKWEESP